MRPALNLSLGDGLQLRALVRGDAALLVEATSGESAPALWGPQPPGPYSLHDGQAALSDWDPAAGGQFSAGILAGQAPASADRRNRRLGAHPAQREDNPVYTTLRH